MNLEAYWQEIVASSGVILATITPFILKGIKNVIKDNGINADKLTKAGFQKLAEIQPIEIKKAVEVEMKKFMEEFITVQKENDKLYLEIEMNKLQELLEIEDNPAKQEKLQSLIESIQERV